MHTLRKEDGDKCCGKDTYKAVGCLELVVDFINAVLPEGGLRLVEEAVDSRRDISEFWHDE
jgi:hypothetical protein